MGERVNRPGFGLAWLVSSRLVSSGLVFPPTKILSCTAEADSGLGTRTLRRQVGPGWAVGRLGDRSALQETQQPALNNRPAAGGKEGKEGE